LVLDEGNGALWWIEDPLAVEHYEAITSTDALLAGAVTSSSSDTLIWPWVVGGLAAAGGIALAAGGGGGGGGGGGDGSVDPGPLPVDTTPPDAPKNLVLSADGLTLTGTAEPNSNITIRDQNGNIVGKARTNSDGKFTVELGTPYLNGETLTATATDQSGNVSHGTSITAPDATAPDAPEITLIDDNVGSITGPVTTEQPTDDRRPTFSGIGEAGSTITIFDNGVAIGTALVKSNGSWTFTPGKDLIDGEHHFTASAKDKAGNVSPVSDVFTITVDTTAPGAPAVAVVTDSTGSITGQLEANAVTDATRPTFSGSGEAGSTITLYDNGEYIGETTVNANGTWSYTPPTPLSEGAHAITVTETDRAGNTSTASPAFDFTVDITPPAQPTATINPEGTVISGTADAGTAIVITNAQGQVIGTATAGINGEFSITLTTPLAEGEVGTVVSSDVAGNKSPAVSVSNSDNIAPDAPANLVVATSGDSISGKAEAGSTVTIRGQDGKQIGQGKADDNGDFTISLSPKQVNGEALTAIATDKSLNNSQPGYATAKDTTPPDAPTNLKITDDGATVTGKAEAGSTVTIKDGSTVLGSGVAGDNGSFTVTLNPAKLNGETLTAIATDKATNASQPGTITAPDHTAPSAPVITDVIDNVEGITGTITNNSRTNDANPELRGTGEPGSKIYIYSGTDQIGTVDVPASGNWVWTSSVHLREGGHVFTAKAIDAAGNLSAASGSWTIIIDTVQPVQPTITQVIDDVPGVTGPVSNNGVTNDNLLTLNGTAEPGATVSIRVNGTQIDTVVAGDNGNWTWQATQPLPDATYKLSVVAIDAAGNSSVPSADFTVTVNTATPTVPTITTVTDDVGNIKGPIVSGVPTDDALPSLQGKGPANATITIKDGDKILGTTTTNDNGDWSFTPTTPLLNGSHTITVVATNAAGNSSTSGDFTLVIDTVAPTTPGTPVITVNPDGPDVILQPGGVTRDTTPTLTGTGGNEGDVITIYNGTDKIGEAVVQAGGGWTWTPNPPLTGGNYNLSLTVTGQDGAGNESAPTQPISITIDTVAPNTPAAPVVTDNVSEGVGPVSNDGFTNDNRPVLSGTGTPNDVIIIYDQTTGLAQEVGRVTVGSDGKWSWRSDTTLDEGTHNFTIRAVDEAGNQSELSTAIRINVDTLDSTIPDITAVRNDASVGITLDGATNDNTPTVSGTGTNGDTVILYNNGVEIGRGLVSNGVWSITSPTLKDGPVSLTVASKDAAGNVSDQSDAFTFTVDTVAPGAPQIGEVSSSTLVNGVLYTNDDTPTLTGTGEPGSTITVIVDGLPGVPVQVNNEGVWTWTAPAGTPLDEGDRTIRVVASDNAGNETNGAPITVRVDVTPPATPDATALGTGGSPLTGTGEAGSTITVTGPGGVVLGTGVVGSDNTFSIPLSPAQTTETTLTLTATDAAGNNSLPDTFDVETDTSNLPAIPVITSIIDDNGASGNVDVKGGSSNDATPTLNGTAVVGSTVSIYLDGSATPIATVVATDGTWTWHVPDGSELPDGPHSFTVTATVGSDTSPLSPPTSVTIDTVPPAAPSIGTVIDDVGPVTGAITSGQATNDNRPTVNGTGTPGDTITLYDGTTVLGTATVGLTGNWSITPSLANSLVDGSHSLTITATDPAGNESGRSTPFVVVVDTLSTTPAITGATDNVEPGVGNVANGASTNDTTPTLTGTAEANSSVAIYEGSTLVGTVTANGSGIWTFTPSAALSEGTHSWTAVATDPQGNVSTSSNAWSVVVDVTPPDVPAITTITDNMPGYVGDLANGQTTNDNTPLLTGTGVPGSTVHILDNGTEIATATVNGSGIWTAEINLTDGPHSLRVNASDAAGNVSANSPVFSINVDTAPPAAPAITTVVDDVLPVTGTLKTGDSTNDPRPTFNGTGEVGSTVTIFNDGANIGTVVVNASGTWTFTPTADLGEGKHTITFSATDPAGNTGPTSSAFELTVDTQIPTAPVISQAADNVGAIQDPLLTSGLSTDDTTPTLSGTAALNATITIFDNGTQIGTAQADGTGAWTFTPGTALVNGSHTFTAVATDAAGNVSPASTGFTVIVDTIKPLQPVITLAVDDVDNYKGPLTNGQSTNDTLPQLNGTSEPNAIVRIYEGNTLLGEVKAGPAGEWSLTLSTVLPEGTHTFTARAVDAAGNVSDPSASFVLRIDTTPPIAPVLVSVTDDVGTVTTITSGQPTNDNLPTFAGTAESGSTVNIYEGTTLLGTATATNGSWTFTPNQPLSDGNHTLTFSATDAAGNEGPKSAGFVVNVDTTAPGVPVISSVVDDVGPITGPITGANPTNDTRPTLSGTAEANSIVRIYDGTTLVGETTANGSGNWTLTQTNIALSNGQHNFTATATDAAGNTSAASSITSIIVDTIAPGLPATLAVTNNGTLVTGTAEAGSTVTILAPDGVTVLGTAVANGSGSFSATITPPQTLGELLGVFATDKAGNVGSTASVTAPFTNVPNAPVITTIDDNFGTIQGNVTNGKSTDDTTPTLSGTAQANSVVTLYDNGQFLATVTTNGSGSWTYTPNPALGEGSHAFTATAANSAGTSIISGSTTIIVDVTPPGTPVGTFNADGSLLSGTAEAGSTITLLLPNNSTLTTTADANGNWSYTFLDKQSEGEIIRVSATDAAGNSSGIGNITAPVVPLSASDNVVELAVTTDATVTNAQYSDYGFLLVGGVGNVLSLLGNDTAQVGFTVPDGGSANIEINAAAAGVVLSLLNTMEVVVQRWNGSTWTTVVDTGLPQFANLLTLGASGVTLNMTGLEGGQYRVMSYNTSLLATGSYTSLDVDVTQTSAGTLTGPSVTNGNVITDIDPVSGSDTVPNGTVVSSITNINGETVAVGAGGATINGLYGTLTIAQDGTYVYTLTNKSASVLGRTESFTYNLTGGGETGGAKLVISVGANTVTNSVTAVDDVASLTFDTTVATVDNGKSSQNGFTVVGVNLGNVLNLNLLDDLSNPIIYNVAEGTTRTMTIQSTIGGVAIASVFDLYVYKFNAETQTFERMRVEPGWLRAPLLGGTSGTLTLTLPAGEYLFLLNTAAGITALASYRLDVLEDHVYTVSSVTATTSGDVTDGDILPAGTLVTQVNGVNVNATGDTKIVGEYGTLTINAQGKWTYTLNKGVGADHISTPDTFVYTVTAPNGNKDTATLNITPTPRAMDAVNDVSSDLAFTATQHTVGYSDTDVGRAQWGSLLVPSSGSGNGTFVVDANTALHNVVLHFNVASLLSLTGMRVDWTISQGGTVYKTGSFNGGILLGGVATIAVDGLDLNAGTYTLSYTGYVGALGLGTITITPSVTGSTVYLNNVETVANSSVVGNIFDGTGSQGAMDQLHSVDTRLSVTAYNGTVTTLNPYETSNATATIQGHYGKLVIGVDGHYTYTLDSGVSLASMNTKETFTYKLTGSNGATDTATLTINLAPKFVSSEHNDTFTGTAYGDTLIYHVLNNTTGNGTGGNASSVAGDHWTNFSLSQGDKIDIHDLLVGWNGQSSTLGNYLHVTTDGSNTVISIDRDGAGTAYTNTTLVTLDNVQTTYEELVSQNHIIT
jgi:VCBS repeat-containing protein